MSAFALLAGLLIGIGIGLRAGIGYAREPEPTDATVFCDPDLSDYPSNYRHD